MGIYWIVFVNANLVSRLLLLRKGRVLMMIQVVKYQYPPSSGWTALSIYQIPTTWIYLVMKTHGLPWAIIMQHQRSPIDLRFFIFESKGLFPWLLWHVLTVRVVLPFLSHNGGFIFQAILKILPDMPPYKNHPFSFETTVYGRHEMEDFLSSF